MRYPYQLVFGFLITLIVFDNGPLLADCDHWNDSVLQNPKVKIVGKEKNYFQSQPKACPKEGKCPWRLNSYLVAGDLAYQVIAAKDGFSCIGYAAKNKRKIVGWMDESVLQVMARWVSENNIHWSSDLEISNFKEIQEFLKRPFSSDGKNSKETYTISGRCYLRESAKRKCTELEVKEMILSNCQDLLDAESVFTATSGEWARFKAWLASCKAVGILSGLRPAKSSFFEGFAFGPKSLKFLPPSLDMAISNDEINAAKRAEVDGKSLAKTNPKLKIWRFSDLSMQLEDDRAELGFEMIARGDYDGDGVEDLLISSWERVKNASYAVSKLLVLTRKGPDAILKTIAEFR